MSTDSSDDDEYGESDAEDEMVNSEDFADIGTETEESNGEDEDEQKDSEDFADTGTDSEESDSEDGNDHWSMTIMSLAVAIAQGAEFSPEAYELAKNRAEESEDEMEKLHLKYILCAQAAQHGEFIEPAYFGNLSELLTTDNMIIRQCVMWAFALILPCKNVLNPLLIHLLYKSLKDETLGWSISYLFRKMSEYEKYMPMIKCAMWISMAKLLSDLSLSEQVRTTLVFTLNNVYKVRKWIAPVIKQKFEQLIRLDGIGTRVLIATVQSLHSMALVGAHLEAETIARLRYLSSNSDNSSMESIHELVDFLDNKRILSHASGYTGAHLKKELVATQNMSVSRSEEESVEPTVKLHSMDHLLNTVGHLGRTFNAESKPIDVLHGDNQAWYRTTYYEVRNLGSLAKQGKLKDDDFDYLRKNFRDGPHWGATLFNTKETIFEMIAGAFRDTAEVKQAIPSDVLDVMIDRLSGTNERIHHQCAEGLLFAMKNRQSFIETQMKSIENKLKNSDDAKVKQHLIELYALHVSKGHHFKLDLTAIVDNLLNTETSETASYLFFKAAPLEKRTFSNKIMETLGKVASAKKYNAKARDNCLWTMAYSIKQTEEKTSISSNVIDGLGDLLADHEKSVKQTAAIALCYYASDSQTSLSMEILKQLAEMLNERDYGLLNNILSVYLRLSKQGKEIPDLVLNKLIPFFYHEDYEIREKSIWILKHVVDNDQEVKLTIIDQIDGCLNGSQFGIRNPVALIFISDRGGKRCGGREEECPGSNVYYGDENR